MTDKEDIQPEPTEKDTRQGFDDLLDNIEDLEPEYSQVITDNFWELI